MHDVGEGNGAGALGWVCAWVGEDGWVGEHGQVCECMYEWVGGTGGVVCVGMYMCWWGWMGR